MSSTSTETVNLTCSLRPEQGQPLYLVRQVNGSYSPEFELSSADSLGFDSSVAASDFNGDGLVDVAWTDGSRTAIYLAAGSRVGRRATRGANLASHACKRPAGRPYGG